MASAVRTVADTIRERRTIREFNGKPLEKETILELLDVAVWAPFHSAKEPWRFLLFMGEGRGTFANAARKVYPKETLDKWDHWIQEQYCELMQAHLLVVIKADPRQKMWEEAYAAASAMIQNFQLLAWERQIGVVWKTNEYNWDPRFYEAVGIKPDERIVATLHLGRFDKIPRGKSRTPVEKLLTFIDN